MNQNCLVMGCNTQTILANLSLMLYCSESTNQSWRSWFFNLAAVSIFMFSLHQFNLFGSHPSSNSLDSSVLLSLHTTISCKKYGLVWVVDGVDDSTGSSREKIWSTPCYFVLKHLFRLLVLEGPETKKKRAICVKKTILCAKRRKIT